MTEIARRGLTVGAATTAGCGLLAGVERISIWPFADSDTIEGDPGPVKIVKFADDGTRLGIYALAKVRKSKPEWKKQLTPLQYSVTRRASTEFPFSGALYNQEAAGFYPCTYSNTALLTSQPKFT